MALSTTTTTYGRAAYEAMRDVVQQAKRDDPLAPVTLLVPSEQVGVTARRFLARGLIPGRPAVAGLTVLTVRRLGELLAGPDLAAQGRRPLTDPVLAATVRRVLEDDAGLFTDVREHTGTVRAVAQAHRELRDLSPADVPTLAGHSALVDDVLRLHDAITATTRERWFDPVDLTTAATARLRDDPVVVKPLGLVIGVLLQDLDVHERALLAALADATGVHLVVGMTGDTRADAGALRSAGLSPAVTDTPQPTGDRILHATDPDDEVRCAVREVAEVLRAGTPGHRIAVLYGSADPYARLLHEHLAAAEVTVYGRGVRPTAERLLGRSLLRLLALPDHRYRRDEVLALVADAPVQWQGRRAPSTAWERASREAGVVADRDWDRLLHAAETFRTRARDERDRPEEQSRRWVVERNEREADAAESLHAFVMDLHSRLAALDAAATWGEAADVLRDLWCHVLGGEDLARYPTEEQRAADRVSLVLDGLAGLDAIGAAAPGLLAVREVVELELADDLDRVGTIGVGVHVGPVTDAVGLDVDLVVLVGMAEGLLPGRHRDDPLLPDDLRARTDGALSTLRERLDRQHRHVLAALAGGQRRLLTFPRGDLRRGGERVPSRWLLPTLRVLSGEPSLQASTWQGPCAGVPEIVEVPSHAAQLEAAAVQSTVQEWRQSAVLADRYREDDDRRLASSLILRRARRSSAFTRFDGNLAGTPGLPDPRQWAALSPTALETWTACPHHYLLSHVLGVAAVEEPEALVRIDHRDRGNVIHEVLERFVEENLGKPPADAWSDADAKRLDEIANAVFAEAENRGVTGFRRLWEQDREALRADLRAWLAADSARRRDRQATPAATELPFGTRGRAPVVLDLGDGTSLRLKGKADRVDRCRDGTLLVVDYKSGHRDYWPQLTTDDPTLRGLKLQLPVYALAARQHLDAEAAPVRAEYWFVNRASQFETIGLDVDDTVLDKTREVIRAVADGIAAGMFVARPRNTGNRWGCESCEGYGGSNADVEQRWESKRDDPALAAYLRLIDASEGDC